MDYSRPCFVRRWGPGWVDFEAGYVWIDEDLLGRYLEPLRKREGPVILKGPGASGKSTLLRALAWRLIRDHNETIFYIPLKPGEDPAEPETFPYDAFLKSGALLFIDDAHLDGARWLREFLQHSSNHKEILRRALISTRPLESRRMDREEERRGDSGGPDSQHYVAVPSRYPVDSAKWDEVLEKAQELQPQNFVKPIFEHWKSVRESEWGHPPHIKERCEIALLKRCGIQRRNSEEGGDLWLLAFYLTALERSRTEIIDNLPDINERIQEYIEEDFLHWERIVGAGNGDLRRAAPVLLLLSAAYRHEFPSPVRETETVIQLMDENLLPSEKRKKVSYLDTLEELKKIHEVIKADKVYILPHSARARAFFIALAEKSEWAKVVSDALQRALIKRKIISRKALSDALQRAQKPRDITETLRDAIQRALEQPQITSKNLSLEALWLLWFFHISPESGVRTFIFSARSVRREVAPLLDPREISKRVGTEEDLRATIYLIRTLRDAGYMRLNDLDPVVFSERVMAAEDLGDAAHLIYELMEIKDMRMNEFIAGLNPETLSRRVQTAKSLHGATIFIHALEKVWKEGFIEVLAGLDPEALSERALTDKDLRGWAALIFALYEVGYSRLNELNLNKLSKRVHTSEDLFDAGDLIDILMRIKFERMNDLLAGLDPRVLSARLQTANDLSGSARLITALKRAGYERLNEVLTELDPKELSRKMKAEEPFFSAEFYNALQEAGYERLGEIEYEPPHGDSAR